MIMLFTALHESGIDVQDLDPERTLALWHPRHAHAPSDAHAVREKGRIVTRSEGAEATDGKAWVERKARLCGGSRLIQRTEQRQRSGEKKMREGPIWIRPRYSGAAK